MLDKILKFLPKKKTIELQLKKIIKLLPKKETINLQVGRIIKLLPKKETINLQLDVIRKFFTKQENAYSKIDQLRYLSQSALIEETTVPNMVRMTLIVISVIILSMITWAGFTNVNEIAITEGEVLPSKHIQSIQHLDGGIVSDIDVAEGELVEKGQVLVKLDATSYQKDIASLAAKKLYLQYQSLRLKSFINGTVPTFDEIGEGRDKKIEREQMNAFDSMMKAKTTERNVIEEQITQKNESLQVLEKKKITLSENVTLVKEERDLKKQLMEHGQVSKFNFLDVQKELNQMEGDLNGLESQIAEAKNAIKEYQNRLSSLNAKSIDDAYQQLNQSDTELAQTDEAMQKINDKVERLDIRSPSYGYVKGLKVKTIGGVVEAGKVIIEIVPLEGPLVIETKIQPKDVGHVKVGQHVMVKISSYDFARYGSVNGTLDYISATTFVNDDGTRYYLGKISIDKNYVGKDPNRNVIIPGMTVQADIVTGNKTILAYLLKPIRNSITTAFTER